MKGAIYYDDGTPLRIGNIKIYNSTFQNIHSENGPVLHINSLKEAYNNQILFNEVIMQDIEAKSKGGIVYSINTFENKSVIFKDCQFNNIKAQYGIF